MRPPRADSKGMMPKKNGRPSLYTDKLAAEICIRLATGESLVQICKEDAMPAMGWSFIFIPPW